MSTLIDQYLRVSQPKEYWPDHKGPTTCLLTQAYMPKKPLVELVDIPYTLAKGELLKGRKPSTKSVQQMQGTYPLAGTLHPLSCAHWTTSWTSESAMPQSQKGITNH